MRGRPRHNRPRTPYGQLSRAIEIHPETLALRERQLQQDGIILTFTKIESGRETVKRTAHDRLSGFTLGRLLLRHQQGDLAGGISLDQFNAAEGWSKVIFCHSVIHGYKIPNLMSRAFGWSTVPNDEESIRRIKKKFEDCYEAIMKVCRKNRDLRARNVAWGVVIEDWPIGRLVNRDYGLLRECFNGLGKIV